jgi:hypothetical protein
MCGGEIELASKNAMYQLDAGDCQVRFPKTFETEHHVLPRFDVAMIFPSNYSGTYVDNRNL